MQPSRVEAGNILEQKAHLEFGEGVVGVWPVTRFAFWSETDVGPKAFLQIALWLG